MSAADLDAAGASETDVQSCGWRFAASDGDFEAIQGVIGHEYFHNWSGNRVTCRDWFQLTLKEGLTVFRDQQACRSARLAAAQKSPLREPLGDERESSQCDFARTARNLTLCRAVKSSVSPWQFSMDMISEAVKRVEDVRVLRAAQV